jgi:hypothetical protein
MTTGAFFEDLSFGQTASLAGTITEAAKASIFGERVIEGEAHVRVPSRI